jgi:hypothetical protein
LLRRGWDGRRGVVSCAIIIAFVSPGYLKLYRGKQKTERREEKQMIMIF